MANKDETNKIQRKIKYINVYYFMFYEIVKIGWKKTSGDDSNKYRKAYKIKT